MNICVIQARVGSSRLFGKVLKKIGRKTVIEHMLSQVIKSKLIDQTVVATTNKANDDKLCKLLKSKNFQFFRGSEKDVLDRIFQCAKKYYPKYLVRLTADCPFIDPKIIDKTIKFMKTSNKFDYVSNVHPPTFPDGMDVEVIKFKTFKEICKTAGLKSEREHVTTKIWMNPKKFKIGVLKNKKDFSNIRITLDHKEDLILLKKLYKLMKNKIQSLEKIQQLWQDNLYLERINSNFKREEGLRKSLKFDYQLKNIRYKYTEKK